MNKQIVIANSREIAVELPCSVEQFLSLQKLPVHSVVVEHNGEAVPPSEFAKRMLSPGDKLEVVTVVAGG